jgi:uncharacterized alpha-E superfamily protein
MSVEPPDPTDDPETEPPTEETPAMLLSRVAENAYWAGRYLERAESVARLVTTHTELFIDLPKAAGLTWAPLLAVTGSEEDYEQVHDDTSEEQVVSFLLADVGHAGSVVAALAQARDDLRITRAMLPRRTWEAVNEAHLWAQETRRDAVDRRTRPAWTEQVIRRCHLIAGSIDATMSRDDTYSFIEIGRLVERADMTTRVLGVEADILVAGADEGLGAYTDITWLAVLRSLGAEQMYRRTTGGVVDATGAVRFLLHDATFPRSVEHCLIEVSRWLLELPHQDVPMAECAAVERALDEAPEGRIDPADLTTFVDHLQTGLEQLHESLRETYFLPTPSLAGAG